MRFDSSDLGGLPIFLLIAVILAGCAQQPVNHYVLASTGTVIGVDLSFDPAKQTPQGRLGYHRGEIAIVPSNRKICTVKRDTDEMICEPSPIGTGATESAEVLMEIYYGAIFSSNSSIYQRLAVGPTAVRQDGAAILFARDPNGQVDSDTVNALAAISGIPKLSPLNDPVLNARFERAKNCAVRIKYTQPADLKKFDESVSGIYKNWEALVQNKHTLTDEHMKKIEDMLATKGIDLKKCLIEE